MASPRFAKGTIIRISAEITDYDDTLIDPSSLPTVTVLKDGADVQAATAMTKSEVGKYYYRWQSTVGMDDGKYATKITVLNSGRTSINHDERALYLY